MKKRERTQNWTPEEKRFLLELCEKSLDVLEDKKIDSGTSSLKGMTWIYIHERFGERFGLERDVQRLREQWRRMKGHAKSTSQVASEKRGGGGLSLTDAIRRSLGEPQGRIRGSILQSPTSSTCITGHVGGVCEPSTSGCNGTIRRGGKQMLRSALQKGTATYRADSYATHAKVPKNKNWLGSDSNTSESYDNENDLVMDIKDEIIEPIIDIDEREPSFSLRRKPPDSVLAVDPGNQEADGNTVTESCPARRYSDETFTIEMFKLRKLEQKRKMEIMEKEHGVRMETLEIKRDTKRIKRELLNASINKIVDSTEAATQTTSSVRFGSDQLGSMGSGAGRGGGGGGAIREAGGAFGKMEAAREEEFFYKQQREQLLKLKTDLTDEISFHEEQVKRHQEAIKRHTQRVEEIETKTH